MFFFQAEDGIRDYKVTGVQTCALPISQQLAALTTASAQIAIVGTNVAAATEALRVTQERYRLGAGTLLDLLTAQANMTQAEVNQVSARYNYVIARAQVEALAGHPL